MRRRRDGDRLRRTLGADRRRRSGRTRRFDRGGLADLVRQVALGPRDLRLRFGRGGWRLHPCCHRRQRTRVGRWRLACLAPLGQSRPGGRCLAGRCVGLRRWLAARRFAVGRRRPVRRGHHGGLAAVALTRPVRSEPPLTTGLRVDRLTASRVRLAGLRAIAATGSAVAVGPPTVTAVATATATRVRAATTSATVRSGRGRRLGPGGTATVAPLLTTLATTGGLRGCRCRCGPSTRRGPCSRRGRTSCGCLLGAATTLCRLASSTRCHLLAGTVTHPARFLSGRARTSRSGATGRTGSGAAWMRRRCAASRCGRVGCAAAHRMTPTARLAGLARLRVTPGLTS